MKLDLILDIGDWVRGFLGTSCDPQLRLVSKDCNAVMQKWARKRLQVQEYLSSAALFTWAANELRMPVGKDICEEAAREGHLALLQCFQARYFEMLPRYFQATPLSILIESLLIPRQWLDIKFRWDYKICQRAARGGHLHVLRWLRAQDPPCP
jgi:hypothetical protein